MSMTATTRRDAYVAKTKHELDELAGGGVIAVGNAFSSVLLTKGAVSSSELAGDLLAGADGVALRSALIALGYAPEKWCGLSTVLSDGLPVPAVTLREAIATLDPDTIIVCDEVAADAIRSCYAFELASLPSFEEASLMPGVVSQVHGMRLLNLGDFAASLGSMATKQRSWAWLKQLPPLGEPY